MTGKRDTTEYEVLRRVCEKQSRLSKRVVDDFLIGFAARHHNLEQRMNQEFARYRDVVSKFPRPHVEMFKSQYIAHRIFRENGLLGKFLKNPALNRFSPEEKEYLERQAEVPWRFSFSVIRDKPARDFFSMTDIFSGEEFLLFSPGTSKLKAESQKLCWLNLIGFNGSCWQSYGPIGGFQAFGPEDIFFFATEKNPAIEEESDVQKDIENDPLPYLLLISGAAYPRTFSHDHEFLSLMSEYDSDIPDTRRMKTKFIPEYNDGVYRFTHKKLGEYPHLAQIYYDETKRLLLFHAMTEYGFEHLVMDYNTLGDNIPEDAWMKVRLQMITTAESILKKNIELNEYEELFHHDPDPEAEEHSKKINKFLELVIPQINEGREPDIDEAARKTGLDPVTATDVTNMIRQQIRGAKGSGPVKAKTEPAKKKKAEAVKKVPESILLNRIFVAANLICSMEPWEDLRETDIFGVTMPGSGLTWYISVMGSNGEFAAVAAYRGIEGLAGFYHIQDNAESIPETTILTIPHLLLSFNDREELDKEALEAVRKSGVTVRGKGRWPRLEEIVPGYIPVFPEEKSLQELPVLLEQVIDVLFDAIKKPDILRKKGASEKEILIRVPSGNPEKPVWKNQYETPATEEFKVSYKPTCSPDTTSSVSKLKPSRVTIQTDLVLMPAPVKEKGKRGFFPFMLLMMDKSSGMIVGTDLLRPDPDLQSIYDSFPQKLLEAILKIGYRPDAVEFRSGLLLGLTKTFLRQSGCTPVLVDHMPLMEEAIESLMENLNRR